MSDVLRSHHQQHMHGLTAVAHVKVSVSHMPVVPFSLAHSPLSHHTLNIQIITHGLLD